MCISMDCSVGWLVGWFTDITHVYGVYERVLSSQNQYNFIAIPYTAICILMIPHRNSFLIFHHQLNSNSGCEHLVFGAKSTNGRIFFLLFSIAFYHLCHFIQFQSKATTELSKVIGIHVVRMNERTTVWYAPFCIDKRKWKIVSSTLRVYVG